MAVSEKKRKQVYEDCTINGLSQSHAAKKHKLDRKTVRIILDEFANESSLIKGIKETQNSIEFLKNSSEFLDDAFDSKAEALKVFKDGLKAQPLPTVKLKSTKTKRVYKHFKDENGNDVQELILSETHEDEREIQSDKLIEHQMKCADRLLTLLTGSPSQTSGAVTVELD